MTTTHPTTSISYWAEQHIALWGGRERALVELRRIAANAERNAAQTRNGESYARFCRQIVAELEAGR